MTSPATPTNGLDIDALAGLLVKASDDRNTTVVVRCDEARTLLAAYREAEALRARVAVLTAVLQSARGHVAFYDRVWVGDGQNSAAGLERLAAMDAILATPA